MVMYVLIIEFLVRLRWGCGPRWSSMGMHTFKLGNVHAKGVALFEHAFAAALDEVVEALGELSHTFAQVIEAEVDGGEVVGH